MADTRCIDADIRMETELLILETLIYNATESLLHASQYSTERETLHSDIPRDVSDPLQMIESFLLLFKSAHDMSMAPSTVPFRLQLLRFTALFTLRHQSNVTTPSLPALVSLRRTNRERADGWRASAGQGSFPEKFEDVYGKHRKVREDSFHERRHPEDPLLGNRWEVDRDWGTWKRAGTPHYMASWERIFDMRSEGERWETIARHYFPHRAPHDCRKQHLTLLKRKAVIRRGLDDEKDCPCTPGGINEGDPYCLSWTTRMNQVLKAVRIQGLTWEDISEQYFPGYSAIECEEQYSKITNLKIKRPVYRPSTLESHTFSDDDDDEMLETDEPEEIDMRALPTLLDLLPLFIDLTAARAHLATSSRLQTADSPLPPEWATTPRWLELVAAMMQQAVLQQHLTYAIQDTSAIHEAFAWGPVPSSPFGASTTSPSQELNHTALFTLLSETDPDSPGTSWRAIRARRLAALMPPNTTPPECGNTADSDGFEATATATAATLAHQHLQNLACQHPCAEFETQMLGFLAALHAGMEAPLFVQLERAAAVDGGGAEGEVVVGGMKLGRAEVRRMVGWLVDV